MNELKVLRDGTIQITNVDGITYRNTGRNIRDIVNMEKYIKENNIKKIVKEER